jgi:hypothetical protein
MRIALLLFVMLVLPACVSTVGKIVTAPVKVVSQGTDWATTSQDEADRNRGRKIRHAEERVFRQHARDYDEDR